MFYLGYFFGVLSSTLILFGGLFLWRKLWTPPEIVAPEIPNQKIILPQAKKKIPKSLSDKELWIREQKQISEIERI